MPSDLCVPSVPDKPADEANTDTVPTPTVDSLASKNDAMSFDTFTNIGDKFDVKFKFF